MLVYGGAEEHYLSFRHLLMKLLTIVIVEMMVAMLKDVRGKKEGSKVC